MARPKKRTTVRIENLSAKVEELEAQAREDLRKREPFLKEMEECSEAKEFHLHLAELHFTADQLRNIADMQEETITELLKDAQKAQGVPDENMQAAYDVTKQFYDDVRTLIKLFETLKGNLRYDNDNDDDNEN